MAQASFDSFIQSVYNGGTAMDYFDRYNEDVETGEEIKDLSVDDIFGGEDSNESDSKSDADSIYSSDTESDAGSDISNNSDSTECKCKSDDHIRCECRSNDIISTIELRIDSDNTSDDGLEEGSDGEGDETLDSSLLDTIELDISNGEKKNGGFDMPLGAKEISLLLAPYK